MSENYNSQLMMGSRDQLLDDKQYGYLQFEQGSLQKKYNEYLRSATDEADMQYFFENNPTLLPGLYDLHNGPLGDVVISKLKLANEYETDFAFISIDSATAQITFIEIESPKLKVFRSSDDQFTSGFNRSLQQARDWTLWVHQNPTYIKDVFREIYFKDVFRHQRVISRTIIVAGKRADIQKTPEREKRWAGINHDSEPNAVVSYDRLGEKLHLNSRMLQLVCRTRWDVSQLLRSRR